MISMCPLFKYAWIYYKIKYIYTLMRHEVSVPPIFRPKNKPINHFQGVLTSQSTQKLVHSPSKFGGGSGGCGQGTVDYCFNRQQTSQLYTLGWFAYKQNEKAM